MNKKSVFFSVAYLKQVDWQLIINISLALLEYVFVNVRITKVL